MHNVTTMQGTITLNGEPYDLPHSCTLTELLEQIHILDVPVVIEHNGTAILPQNFGSTTVHAGDRIEIVSIVAGG